MTYQAPAALAGALDSVNGQVVNEIIIRLLWKALAIVQEKCYHDGAFQVCFRTYLWWAAGAELSQGWGSCFFIVSYDSNALGEFDGIIVSFSEGVASFILTIISVDVLTECGDLQLLSS